MFSIRVVWTAECLIRIVCAKIGKEKGNGRDWCNNHTTLPKQFPNNQFSNITSIIITPILSTKKIIMLLLTNSSNLHVWIWNRNHYQQKISLWNYISRHLSRSIRVRFYEVSSCWLYRTRIIWLNLQINISIQKELIF